jgi:hypothetical protein
VISDVDEIGFRVVEYGRNRKIVLPDSLKREIQENKLQRELRRRKVGQHTVEKALHAHIRVNSCRKIVAAIEECRKENNEFEDPATGRAIPYRKERVKCHAVQGPKTQTPMGTRTPRTTQRSTEKTAAGRRVGTVHGDAETYIP